MFDFLYWDLQGEGAQVTNANLPLGRVGGILAFIWMLLGILPPLAQILGASFLPSTVWSSQASAVGWVAGLATGALFLWIASMDAIRSSDSDLKKLVFILGAPIMGYWIGVNAVVISPPMIIALVAGQQTEFHLTVEVADSHGTRRCRPALEFQGLPFFFDRICGVSPDFIRELEPGMRILVAGSGTSLGVYVERLHRAD